MVRICGQRIRYPFSYVHHRLSEGGSSKESKIQKNKKGLAAIIWYLNAWIIGINLLHQPTTFSFAS
jgi:hypothetical protein